MNYSVILVQKGITSPTHPVCGISGKVYGNAIASHPHAGVAFAMGLEDYTAGMYDLIGNKTPSQQWVPEFVLSTESASVVQCCIPAGCKLGPGGSKRDACYQWDRYAFCEFHAPIGAAPMFEGAPPIQPPPSPTPEPAPTPELEPEPAPVARFETEPPPTSTAPAPAAPPTVREIVVAVVREELAGLEKQIEELARTMKNGSKPRSHHKAPPSKTQARLTELRARAKELGINSFRMGVAQLETAIAAKEKPMPVEPDIP